MIDLVEISKQFLEVGKSGQDGRWGWTRRLFRVSKAVETFLHLLVSSSPGPSLTCCGRWKPSRRCWKEFVSLSEQVDTSTPTGKMVFTVLGALAELERSLIAERVRAGLRNARAKGKKLGRPRKAVDRSRIARLRRSGASWRAISKQMDVPIGTLYRAAVNLTGR